MAKAKANKKIKCFGKVNIGVWGGKETYDITIKYRAIPMRVMPRLTDSINGELYY